ncbi:energy-coupling factor transporter transmembrane component T family protein [Paludisphaera mucosa]|uniref:CbiQ family ECF transporter T component n=1 Tax=Paludisphaera mucosa TaxID=3030827 RepID=A0ABT6FDM6_9BACT|nr:CbiQ family ECF transporter T component [Paludisphaera mucosa]MDG3005671.1 CbiQ family ECF transporter T component [Paludisphaera mucosa]
MPPDGPLHRLDARVKLVAAVAYVVAVVAAPPGSWRLLGVLAALLVAVAVAVRIPPLRLLLRWLGFAAVVGFLAFLRADGLAARTGMGRGLVVLDLLARSSLAFVMMMVLAHATPWTKLLVAMRRLGMPAALVTTLGLMYRYLFVLHDELDRMTTARRARSFRRFGPGFGTLASLIGVLLFRAMEREERVFAAMTARGWDGTLRTLDD